MKISVTKKDIADGQPNQGSFCPVALALKRNGATNVCVDGSIAEGDYKGHPFWVDLPKKAQIFVHRFDMNKPVKPFSFILDIQ